MTSVWPFLILQVVIFVGLVIVLRRILGRHLIDAAAHLQGLSGEYVRRHEELKRQLQESEQQYQEQMDRVKAESEQVLAQSRQDAESSKTKLLAEARSESERIIQQALQSSQAVKRDFEERVDRRALQRACELIQQVLPGQLRQEMQSKGLDDLIRDGLGQLESLTTQDDIDEATVTSAFPLSAAQRNLLRQRLNERLGREIRLVEATDEGLVAGLTITMGNLVLDGSLLSKIREATRDAQDGS